jgi:hypothetical protein
MNATPEAARKRVIFKKKTRWKPQNRKPSSGPRYQAGFIHRLHQAAAVNQRCEWPTEKGLSADGAIPPLLDGQL